MDLLDWKPSYPNGAGFKTGGASVEAARMMDTSGKRETCAVAVLKHLQQGFVHTAEQVAEATGKPLHSVRSRLTELMECGLVEKLEERGEGTSGIRIHKWRVAA